jgi:beta-mannosidase
MRKLKYDPAGGYAQFQFNDSFPSVTWSVVDHLRIRKAGYDALREASAPVLVMADWPAETYAPGHRIRLDLWVVSELRRPLGGLRLVTHFAGVEEEWAGDVAADSVVRVGTFEADAPSEKGTHLLTLGLRDVDGTEIARNSYEITVS